MEFDVGCLELLTAGKGVGLRRPEMEHGTEKTRRGRSGGRVGVKSVHWGRKQGHLR